MGHVIGQKDPVGSFIVRTGDGPKPLLAGCVPNLQFDYISIKSHGFKSEVDSDGSQVALLESIIGEPSEDGRLSD